MTYLLFYSKISTGFLDIGCVMVTKSELFSVNLGLLIKHYGLSIRKISRATNLDRSHLNRLIQGKHTSPGLQSMEKIANFFKISIAQLIGEQEIDFTSLQPIKISEDEDF